ncbi:tRNA pseudouridine synthase-like 1 [Homarus americanus]|uniref:tRNA pseudouridine synthase n=1 Tax=Homarus americanus TaxID=6706 RepID=A0A8J5K7M1_HOMAM|nr:tRNA pseudouridine synthase-like 1 [Homarus americanus]XP_042219916.1 tRNA pseudouridine synthase-like 1 [Homarus americanus]KAG7170202.1 tRNA pseudouridine synthase-like 1-like [Homarus americanus]
MRRYLLYIGYSGTRLRGIQKQADKVERSLKSVHGLVEEGLYRLRPANTPALCFSSRTDKGVHAVCNTAHVDLSRRTEGTFYDPYVITQQLNRYFKKTVTDIRVHKTVVVPPTFHARFDADGRRYLYRLGVAPTDAAKSRFDVEAFLPTAEINNIYVVRPPFDTERVQSACRMLEGVHDFATFGAALPKNSKPRETTRIIHKISLTPGRPLLEPQFDPSASHLQFWDIIVEGKSFLYKQVRRTVAVLVAVAQGRISLDDVRYLLDNPSPQNWNSRAQTAPPCGLFLLNVGYPEHVLCVDSLHAVGDDDGDEKMKTHQDENSCENDVR